MPYKEAPLPSIAVAYYFNTNSKWQSICPYCRAILEFLKFADGVLKGKAVRIATVPILVGEDLYFKLSPLQHVNCDCGWKYKVIPASEVGSVLTDADISYSAIFDNLPEDAKIAAGEDKWPASYREEIRKKGGKQ